MYILVTFHQSLDRLYRKVAGGTVFDRHDQAVEPPSWDIIAPPFTFLSIRGRSRSLLATCPIYWVHLRLSQEGREIFFEILFEIPNGVLADLLLQHKYVRHRGLPDSPSETNNRMMIFEFPNIYLASIEKLLWPQWYTASFTRIYNNSSMWANYANGHKGVCLIFKTEDLGQGPSLPLNETNDDSRASEGNGGELWSLSPMIFRPTSYSEKPGEVDFFRSIGTLPLQTIMKLWYTNESGDISACASHIKGVLDYGDWHRTYWGTFERDIGIKTKDWHYEEEERLILSSLGNSVLDSRQRTLTYEFNSLAGIIFGIKTTTEDKLRIIEIVERKCREQGRTDFTFYQAYYSSIDGNVQSRDMDINFV